MRKVIGVVLAFVLLAIGGALYLAPIVITTTYMDWKNPQVIDGFEVDTHGQFVTDQKTGGRIRDIKVSWPDGALGKFYLIHELDLQWNHWTFVLFACLFIVVGVSILTLAFSDSDDHGVIIWSLFGVHILLWLIAGIYCISVVDDMNNPAAFETMFIHDKVMKDAVLNQYHDTLLVLWCVIGIIAFAVVDVVVGIIGTLLGLFMYDPVWIAFRELIERIEGARMQAYREELGLPSDGAFLKIAGNTATVRKATITVRWRPLPKPRVSYETMATMPVADLFKEAVAQAGNVEPRVVAEHITARVVNDVVATAAATQLRERVLVDLRAALRNKARDLAQIANQKRTDEAQTLLQEVSDAKLARFQEDLLAGALETASDELAPFKQTVLDSLRGRVIDTLATVSGGLSTMLPVGTRFVGTHGAITLVVMEQQPMMRTVRWTRDSLEGEISDLRAEGVIVTPDMEEHVKNPIFHVAFPYMVYILRFRGNKFVEMRLFCRTEPLKSVTDELAVPPLPNLDDTGRVCLGTSFNTPTGSIAEMAEKVMAYYWDSEFHLHGMDRMYLKARKLHPALRHIWAWEQFSKDNPRFALEIGYWRSNDKRTVVDFWREIAGETARTEMMTYDALVARAMEDGEAKLRDAVRAFIAAVSTNRRYPKVTIDAVDKALREVAQTIADAVDGDIRQFGTNGENAKVVSAFREELARMFLNRVMRERKDLGAGAQYHFQPGSEWLRDIVLIHGERR